MIEFLTSEVSKLKEKQNFEEVGAHCSISFLTPNLCRGTHEHVQILQRSSNTKEDKRVKTLSQNIVMEEVQHEEKVPVLEGAPFLTRVAYEKEISKGTTQQFVVAAKQNAYQQDQSAGDPFILQESLLDARSSSHGYADLQIS